MKIKLLATTKKGSSVITFLDKDQFKQAIEALDGDVAVTFEVIGNEASRKQWYYFREVLVPKFTKISASWGSYLNQDQVINRLLAEAGANELEWEFLMSKEYDASGVDKSELSRVIERVEFFINQYIEK